MGTLPCAHPASARVGAGVHILVHVSRVGALALQCEHTPPRGFCKAGPFPGLAGLRDSLRFPHLQLSSCSPPHHACAQSAVPATVSCVLDTSVKCPCA